jgi:hypothetical protein
VERLVAASTAILVVDVQGTGAIKAISTLLR